jgi:CRP-like cAMP-binding protein
VLEQVRFKAGDVIIRENDEGETAYIIERGRVKVTREIEGREIHLAELGPGEPFGEMSMIDEKPRSATVTALEDIVAREVHRETFFRSLQSDPDVAIHLLRALFERLRESGAQIVRLQQQVGGPAGTAAAAAPEADDAEPDVEAEAEDADVGLYLSGLTPQAAKHLESNPTRITKFPFRIGRRSNDPLVMNDLDLADFMPFQISRHHCALVRHGNRFGVLDRGSKLGCLVEGKSVGGHQGDPGPLFFEKTEGKLILGNKRSQFQFKVVVSTGEEPEKKDSLWDKI